MSVNYCFLSLSETCNSMLYVTFETLPKFMNTDCLNLFQLINTKHNQNGKNLQKRGCGTELTIPVISVFFPGLK